ncbi:MAG: hypothetical protein M1835_007897 [Candelina submexicana]|nr:MAG: hypothetical protein M1835_007897 [Candelina submexicana]
MGVEDLAISLVITAVAQHLTQTQIVVILLVAQEVFMKDTAPMVIAGAVHMVDIAQMCHPSEMTGSLTSNLRSPKSQSRPFMKCSKFQRRRQQRNALELVHPDKHPEDRDDPEKLKHWTDEAAKVTEAQDTLGDEAKKAKYDRQLRRKRHFGIF